MTGVPVVDPATSAVDLNVVVNRQIDCLVTIAHVVATSP